MKLPSFLQRLFTGRYPWLAALLTFLCPGWGQIYNRDWKWLFIAFASTASLTVVTTIYFFDSLKQIVTAILLGLVLTFILCAQAFIRARKLKQLDPAPAAFDPLHSIPMVFVYILYLVFVFAFPDGGGYIIPTRLRSFQIPSESMVPNLLIGDRLVADGWAYWGKEPVRGDVVVFDYPKNPEIKYVKRLIGLPGDVIELKRGELYLNGKIVPQRRTENFALEAGNRSATEYLETIGANEHVIFRTQPEWDQDYGPITVPEGKYFMMGDNRDRSSDSRFWGFVSREQIIGRMAFIFFSWNSDDSSLRRDRIGMQIH